MAVSRRLRFEVFRRDGHACRYCGAMAPDVKLTVDHVVPVALGGSDDATNLVTACADCNAGKSSIQPGSDLVADVAADALRWARALEAAASNMLADRELIDALTDRFEQQWNRWTYEVSVKVPPEPVEPTGDPLVDNWYRLGWPATSWSRPVGFADGVLSIQIQRGFARDVRRALNLRDKAELLSQILGSPVSKVEIIDGWPGPFPPPPTETTRTERRTLPLPSGWRSSVERFFANGLPESEIHRFVAVTMERRRDDEFTFFCGCCWRAITDLQEDARRIVETENS